MTIEIYNLSLVENAETIPLLFTPEFESRGTRFDWMINLHGVLHDMQWMMFRGLLELHQAHLKEAGLTQKQETTIS